MRKENRLASPPAPDRQFGEGRFDVDDPLMTKRGPDLQPSLSSAAHSTLCGMAGLISM